MSAISDTSKMDTSHEQRINVKFCYKLGKTFTETFETITSVYDESLLSRTDCHEWFRRFKDGRESIEDDPRSDQPSTSTDDSQANRINRTFKPTVDYSRYGRGL